MQNYSNMSKIKNKKKIAIIIIAIIIIILLAVLLLIKNYKNVNGKIEYSNNAVDDTFNVTMDAPILVRNVEMVQYNKNEDGTVEKVFANYHIDSFDDYENPEFPSNLNTEVFYGDLSINGNILTDNIIREIAYSDNTNKIQLNEIPEIENADFVKLDNYYVSASNDWKVGELRISYYYIDKEAIYSFICNYKGNKLLKIVKILP